MLSEYREHSLGIRGFNIVQINIATDGFSTNNPRTAPFLIQGQGKDVYIVNITIPVGDKGIDLASYNTSGHYVDYFAGALILVFSWKNTFLSICLKCILMMSLCFIIQ